EVLDVIAENPEEQHVASQMDQAAVQEHTGNQGQERELKRRVTAQERGEAGGDRSEGESQGAFGLWRKNCLVKKNHDIGNDQQRVDDRVAAVRIQILQRYEHGGEPMTGAE